MTGSLKKCPRCGEEIPAPAVICSKCGMQQTVTWDIVKADPGDEILKDVNQLCQELSITDIHLSKVDFVDYFRVGRGLGRRTVSVPSDTPVIEKKRIVLPLRLAGSITPKQWTALIAAALIVRSWALPRRRKAFSFAALIALALYLPIFWFTILDGLSSASGPGIFVQLLLAPLALVGGMIVVGVLFSPKVRAEAFQADREVAGLVGKDTLLEALLKLESLRENHSRTSVRAAKYKYPNIRERIENLTSPQ